MKGSDDAAFGGGGSGRNDGEWMKHTANWFTRRGGKVGTVHIDYRPVHEYTLTDDVACIELKKRVY